MTRRWFVALPKFSTVGNIVLTINGVEVKGHADGAFLEFTATMAMQLHDEPAHVRLCREVISRLRVGGCMPIMFEVRNIAWPILYLTTDVPERSTGQHGPLIQAAAIPLLTNRLDMLEWVRLQVHNLYRHEADEQLTVVDDNGSISRPFDPHREERT